MGKFTEELYYEKRDDEILIYEGALGCLPHLHHVIEIAIVLTGEVFAGVDQKEFILNPGDILVAFPNQVHMYELLSDSLDIIMFLEPDYFPELDSVLNGMIPKHAVVSDETGELIKLAKSAMAESRKESTVFSKSITKGLMLVFLTRLLERMELQRVEDYDSQSLKTLKRILYYCDDHYTEESFSLESAAAALQISKYYLSRLFNERMKISFSDYLGHLRVRQACKLLNEGKQNISSIALECGFNSIRSFNRHFHSLTGVSPSDYRKTGA